MQKLSGRVSIYAFNYEIRCVNTLGHFRVTLWLCAKTNPRAKPLKMSLICMKMNL